MAAKRERFGEGEPSLANPLIVREVLLHRLGTLFNFVPSKGDWGGGVEPDSVSTESGEQLLMVGGIACFGSSLPSSRNVGVLSQVGKAGAFFTLCEWECSFQLEPWLLNSPMATKAPLRWVHLVPEPGADVPHAVDLDVYAVGVLNLTTFMPEVTEELRIILSQPGFGYAPPLK